jgi:dehydrodolichyl diphosphate syntase complex subunit NUS1
MGLLAVVILRVLHFIYGLSLFVYSFLKRRHSSKSPQRARVPKHLALILVASVDPESEECLMQCVIDAVGWCRSAGIEKLTVYDEHGMSASSSPFFVHNARQGQIQNCSQQIREFFSRRSVEESSDSEIEFPLTPPSSDSSLSRPISPEDCLHLDTHTMVIHIADHPIERKRKHNDVKRRRRVQSMCLVTFNVLTTHFMIGTAHDHDKPFTLCLASRNSSKPALALAAQSFVLKRKSNLSNHSGRSEAMSYTLNMDDLDSVLEGVATCHQALLKKLTLFLS